MKNRFDVIAGAYVRDILEQPAACERTQLALAASSKQAAAIRHLVETNAFDRIVLTGMGSSYHALHPLQIRLSSAGRLVQMLETSELLGYYPELLGKRTLTVAVSQSGESAEIVRLLSEQVVAGPVIGVSNSSGSTLAGKSSIAILSAAGQEATVSCKTYLATLQVLHWLGSTILGHDLAQTQRELQQATLGVRSYLAQWDSHTDWFVEQLAGIRQIFVTGRGWSLATAGTGGLILKESVRYSAEGMSSAAFRHGPLEMLSQEILTCICLGDPRTEALNRRLHEDVSRAQGKSFLLSPDAEQAALRLSKVSPALLPMVEMLPIQMISLALGARLGIEAGRFEVASKITSVE